jgi:phage terminase large subunit GpA-like protein
MPRLIEINPELEKRATHKECGAVIGYYQNEVQSYIYHDYGGGSETIYYIVCPHCGKQVTIKSC